MMEFQPWPKTPRLFRDVIVTEKIDGTNAAVVIEQTDQVDFTAVATPIVGGVTYNVAAQSRSRLLGLDKGENNHGFARWVAENAQTLVRDLGDGRHFGEWWGQGIQRGYGLNHKRFSLFNVTKWWGVNTTIGFDTENLTVVPCLYTGLLTERTVESISGLLSDSGSAAAPGFMNPEGICVFHTASRQVYKYTLDGDGHKG
jgi:RNA ligase